MGRRAPSWPSCWLRSRWIPFSGNFKVPLVIFVGLQVCDKVRASDFHRNICKLCFPYGIKSEWDKKRVLWENKSRFEWRENRSCMDLE